MSRKTFFVVTLPAKTQETILERLNLAKLTPAEIEDAMSSRLIDLEDTITISDLA